MLRNAIILLIVGLAATVVVGGGSPVRPGYVTSDSMAPTLQEGDAILIIDTGEPDIGDIVTYYSERRGRYVTHRVIDRTDGGYITKGDANEVSDQGANNPPVALSSVVGEVPTIAGYPLAIPNGAPIIKTIERHRLLIAAGLVGFVLLGESKDRKRPDKHPSRGLLYAGEVIRPLFLGMIVIGLLSISAGASTHDLTYVVTESGTTSPKSIRVGESAVRSVEIETATPPLTTTVIDVVGVTVLDRSTGDSTTTLKLKLPAQESIGPFRAQVQIYTYPSTLPKWVLERLHRDHWILAGIASIGVLLVPLMVIHALLIDPKAPLRSTRHRWIHRRWGR